MKLIFKNTKVLVTGAEGFIGSHLCEALVKSGASVKALVLYNTFNKIGWLQDLPSQVKQCIEIIPGDIRDPDLVLNITKGVDIVFHLAALISIPYSYQTPRSYLSTNTFGMLNVLEAVKRNSINRLISTSTSEVYGSAIITPINEEHKIQAQSPYAASKISADHLLDSFVRSYDMPAVILRPFNTYGPRQSEKAVISSIIRQAVDDNINKIKLGNLATKRDFNYVDDTVKAFIMLSKADKDHIEFGNAYNAGSGQAVSIESVLKKIMNITNCNKEIISEKERFRPEKSEVEHLIACSSRLTKLVNWVPDNSLDEGLKKTVEWWVYRKEQNKIRIENNYSI